jgi:hypothetical protein
MVVGPAPKMPGRVDRGGDSIGLLVQHQWRLPSVVAGAVPLVRRQQQPPPMVTVMCGLILGQRRRAVVLGTRLDPLSSTAQT